MLKQLSVFAENKKGTMQNLTEILFQKNINILGSVTNDSAEYGIVRMIVSDPEEARASLTAAGYMCRLADVLGVELSDEPGTLNRLLLALQESNVNIDYIYLSYNRRSGKPIIVLHAPDVFETQACLESKGYTLL